MSGYPTYQDLSRRRAALARILHGLAAAFSVDTASLVGSIIALALIHDRWRSHGEPAEDDSAGFDPQKNCLRNDTSDDPVVAGGTQGWLTCP